MTAAKIASVHHQQGQEILAMPVDSQAWITTELIREIVPVLAKVTQTACALLTVRSCSLALVAESGTALQAFTYPPYPPYPRVAEEAAGGEQDSLVRIPWLTQSGIDSGVIQSRQLVVIDDLAHATQTLAISHAYGDHSGATTGSLACLPLLVDRQCLGTLTLVASACHYFDAECLHRCMLYAEQAALTLLSALQAKRAATDLQQQERAQTRFISLLAHELRSPLNAVNGYLELLLTGVGGTLSAEQSEFVRRARSGSEQLYALLEDLLLISRVDSGHLRLTRELITFPPVVENAVEEFALSAADNRITIAVDVPQLLPRLYADALRLQQVIRNLLSNALRFTPDGGHVYISATVEEAVAGHPLSAARAEDALDDGIQKVICLRVRDEGCGIAPEYQQRIFERFYQIKGAGELRAGGLGLGLTIVKLIVELHGGRIELESEPGKGSTFLCRFPCLIN
jgi:Signal transduction histidine kinase